MTGQGAYNSGKPGRHREFHFAKFVSTLQVKEQVRQRQRNWNEIVRQKQVVDSRDKVKHVEGNVQLFASRMM